MSKLLASSLVGIMLFPSNAILISVQAVRLPCQKPMLILQQDAGACVHHRQESTGYTIPLRSTRVAFVPAASSERPICKA